MRKIGLALIMITFLVGCSPVPTAVPGPGADQTLPVATNSSPPNLERVPPSEPEPPMAPPRALLADPAVRTVADGLEVTGLENGWVLSWSPSGRRAVMLGKSGAYLLDTEGPSISRLDLEPWGIPVFWSESELFWEHGGRLQVRSLADGTDRLLHDFGAPVIHFLRPGDARYVANREKGVVQQGYRFGTIVAGALGGQTETTLIETGHLVGRMRNGQVLAAEGYRDGPLWAITNTGEKRLLSKEAACFVQLSPDGGRALWFTRSPQTSSWLDLFKSAVAYADGPYDPPLADLWIWAGSGDPVRIPLGGTFSARARFSPDGESIALALNGAFDETVPPGTVTADRPGRLAVVNGNEIQPLATFDGPVGLGIWLGGDGFWYSPPAREKTGAQAPIMRISLAGEQTQFSGGIWYEADARDGRSLIVNWKGDLTTVHWSDSAQEARIRFDPNEHAGSPLYVPSTAPYLPFVSGDKVVCLRVTD